MPDLRLRSNDGAFVTIATDPLRGYSWLVSLEASDLAAKARVDYGDYYPTGRVAAFFDDLALDWRGWTNEKTWRSTDDRLRFTASHDGLGHVTLRATLRDQDWSVEDWIVDLQLRLDAGSLDAIAREVRVFDRP